jgi:hypothetical protein
VGSDRGVLNCISGWFVLVRFEVVLLDEKLKYHISITTG